MEWSDFFFGFDGRISRTEFWFFVLVLLGYVLVAGVLNMVAGDSIVFSIIVRVAPLYPCAAIATKRLHDRERNERLALAFVGLPFFCDLPLALGLPWGKYLTAVLIFVTVVIVMWAIVELGFAPGTPGENRYGPDPAIYGEVPPGGHSVKLTVADAAGTARQEFYYVAEPDPEEARRTVRNAKGAPDGAVKTISPILQLTVDNLGLQPGEFVPAPRATAEAHA